MAKNSEVEVAALAAADERKDLIGLIGNSIYPGAKVESIELALNYCQQQDLDVLLKPVHIVPMYDRDLKGFRDVIMPGIGLYRTQAARTQQYAGISEPEYGPSITKTFPEERYTDSYNKPKTREAMTVIYPEWCKLTVNRLMNNGMIAQYTVIEFWTENYATKGRDSIQPNDMWGRRVFGQLAKCAEAQALRKAFPEVGSLPTIEEMEGKTYQDFHGAIIDNETGVVEQGESSTGGYKPTSKKSEAQTEVKQETAKPDQESDLSAAEVINAVAHEEIKHAMGTETKPKVKQESAAPAKTAEQKTEAAARSAEVVSVGEANFLRNKAKSANVDEAEICARFNVNDGFFDNATKTQWAEIKKELTGK